MQAWKTGEKTTDSKVVSSAASPKAPYFFRQASFDVALVPVPWAIAVSVHFDVGYEKNCLRAAPVKLGLAVFDNGELAPDYLAVYVVSEKIPIPGTEDLLWSVLENSDSVDPDKQRVEQDALDLLASTYGLPKSKGK